MRVVVKEIDGQREVEVEVTELLPDSLFLSYAGKCFEFDRRIFSHAVARAQDAELV